MNFIDLFAGAGGLSEGFIRQGFKAVAHIEMSAEAADTLKTRAVYHYLSEAKNEKQYHSYLFNNLSRDKLWKLAPSEILDAIINQEISDKTIDEIFHKIDVLRGGSEIDLIIGGPPCQAYSLVGRSRDPNGMKKDKRNFLFRYYAEFLKRYKPKFFVFENVLGLLTAGNSRYLDEMLELFSQMGYSVDWKILKAEEFGVLQKRRRVIIIGRKGKKNFQFPQLESAENNWQTKRDLFFDLPFLRPGQEISIAKYTSTPNEYLKNTKTRNGIDFTSQHITRNHNDRDLEIYSIAIDKWMNDKERLKYNDLPKRLQSHNNTDAFLDRYKVVDPYGPSHTVVAHIAKDGHYYIYPDLKQIRSLSVREAARLQSFPDDFFFEGGRTAAFRQIGNAVPPLMAEKIAASIKYFILNGLNLILVSPK